MKWMDWFSSSRAPSSNDPIGLMISCTFRHPVKTVEREVIDNGSFRASMTIM